VGDSLSAAQGIDPTQGWVTLLAKRLADEQFPYQVVNISMGGDTTSNGIDKLPAALQHYHPAVVILALGANDGLRGLPATLIQKNLSTLVELAERSQAKILLVGLLIPLNYGPDYRQQFEEAYQKVIRHYHLIHVPFLLKNIALNPNLMQADGLHPTATAQPIILENVWPFLMKMIQKT